MDFFLFYFICFFPILYHKRKPWKIFISWNTPNIAFICRNSRKYWRSVCRRFNSGWGHCCFTLFCKLFWEIRRGHLCVYEGLGGRTWCHAGSRNAHVARIHWPYRLQAQPRYVCRRVSWERKTCDLLLGLIRQETGSPFSVSSENGSSSSSGFSMNVFIIFSDLEK